MRELVGIFTADGREKIKDQRGTGQWPMRVEKEREGIQYAALFRKRIHQKEDTHDVPHGRIFAIGKIERIERNPPSDKRVFIRFSEVAWFDTDSMALAQWNGQQFPLNYQLNLDTLGIDPEALKWESLDLLDDDPDASKDTRADADTRAPEMGILERHRLMIAQETGLPVERIICDIRL